MRGSRSRGADLSSERGKRMNRIGPVFAAGFMLLLSLAAAPTHADLYRCIGRDGGLVFTNDEARCPGAARHQTSGTLQTHATEAPPSPSPAPADIESLPSAADTDANANAEAEAAGQTAMKNHWQAKKRAKEDELRALQQKAEKLSRYVSGCNRGAEIITRDEYGIKRSVACESIRDEYAQALEGQKPIREYLDGGLRRECRKAGCLPGWIR